MGIEKFNISDITKGDIKYLKSECKFFLGILIKKGTPLNGVVQDKYGDNKLKIEGNLKDGKKHGLQQSWWETKQLSHEVIYKNGRKDGVERKWYKNGQLGFEMNYRDGRVGSFKIWYRNGKLATVVLDDDDGVRSDIWGMDGELMKREDDLSRWEERAEGIPIILSAFTYSGGDY